jgi:hypothetical protein
MSRNATVLVAICGLAAAGSVTPCRAEGSDPNPVVVVTVENPNGLEVPGLARAQELTREIYNRAGVSLRWASDETMELDRSLTMVLTISTAVPRDLGSDAMGVAPSPGDGTRGTLAYVFLDKVQSFAASHRLSVAPVLACALAHEVGHLLLPPNAHRPDSVMRGAWHAGHFPPRAPGILGFPPDQAKLLRLRARRQ